MNVVEYNKNYISISDIIVKKYLREINCNNTSRIAANNIGQLINKLIRSDFFFIQETTHDIINAFMIKYGLRWSIFLKKLEADMIEVYNVNLIMNQTLDLVPMMMMNYYMIRWFYSTICQYHII